MLQDPLRYPIVVLVGAGASHVSEAGIPKERTPLTWDLFSCDRAKALLPIYTLANEASSVIRRYMKANTAIAFEDALKRLETDGHAHHEQMALAVPPFLQALMLEYSQSLQTRCSRYGVLVDELLKLRAPLVFVSLNYDTLLDNTLAAYSPLDTLDSYIEAPLRWSLIKPHGSVAWYVAQPAAFDPRTPPGGLAVKEAPIECVPTTTFDLSAVRNSTASNPHGPSVRYPALALPDGPKDELILPPAHREHLQAVLHNAHEIYLLVLGYSGLDSEILKLIADIKPTVRRATVVNSGPDAALEVFERVTAAGIDAIYPDVFDGKYADWIDQDRGLVRWASEYLGRPESAKTPAQLRETLAERDREKERQKFLRGRTSIRRQEF
ncbi:MAG: hypothetical protein ABSG64_06245 [Solirubrobacteraceae bacterium]